MNVISKKKRILIAICELTYTATQLNENIASDVKETYSRKKNILHQKRNEFKVKFLYFLNLRIEEKRRRKNKIILNREYWIEEALLASASAYFLSRYVFYIHTNSYERRQHVWNS